MVAAFENHLRSGGFSEGDIAQICSLAIPCKLRRNEQLLTEGHICRHKTFVASGMLMTYTVKEDGSEHILQFSPQQHWIMDVESYNRQMPARFNIGAVEPSEVLMWAKPDFDKLLADLPKLKHYAEELITRNIYSSRQRIATMLSGTPEEKYEDFVQSFPDLMPRLPLRMIAAYLGISLKTLTRIRRAQILR